MERQPDDITDKDRDLFGDPDEVDESIEEQLDRRLQEENEDE